MLSLANQPRPTSPPPRPKKNREALHLTLALDEFGIICNFTNYSGDPNGKHQSTFVHLSFTCNELPVSCNLESPSLSITLHQQPRTEDGPVRAKATAEYRMAKCDDALVKTSGDTYGYETFKR